jgi:hypothetical protein
MFDDVEFDLSCFFLFNVLVMFDAMVLSWDGYID